ncbi:MAG: LacI family DNA-binding transcriptional regulator [Protaetiibacter sp.]
MRDVAALAGVGLKTVSRVINGEEKVAPETAERVLRAASQLDYRPDFYAGTLKRGDRRTRTIGLVVGNVANPFSGSIGRAVEDVATDHGSVVLTSSLDDDPAREERVVAHLLQRRVDGLVLTTARSDQSYLVREQERGTAIAFVDRAPTGIVADVVVTDNAESSAAAVRHLADHGHRRIAYLGDRPQLWTAHERLRGYRSAAPDQTHVVEDVEDEDEAAAATEALLSRPDPPTALFTAQNLITIGAIRALRRLGLSHRVALVGFDDIPLGDLVEPAITVVRQEPYEIGRRAAELVFARLADPALPPRTHVIRSTLVPRGSGEIPPEGA